MKTYLTVFAIAALFATNLFAGECWKYDETKKNPLLTRADTTMKICKEISSESWNDEYWYFFILDVGGTQLTTVIKDGKIIEGPSPKRR